MPDETTVAGTMNRHFVYIFKKLKLKEKKCCMAAKTKSIVKIQSQINK